MKLVCPKVLIKITELDFHGKSTGRQFLKQKCFFHSSNEVKPTIRVIRPHPNTSITALTKSKLSSLSYHHNMSGIRQRLINKRNEQARADLALQLYDPPTVQDRPIDATYIYPTGNFVIVNGQPKQQCVVQRAVEPKHLDKLLSRSRALAQTREDGQQSDRSTVGPFGIDEQQRNMEVEKYADKAFKLLRERLLEKMPSVRREKYPQLHFLTLMDVKAALREQFEYGLPSHSDAFLDSFVAGLLTGLGYGQHCCEVCGMVFNDRKELDNHKKNRFQTPFQCGLDDCQRELCTVDALNFHSQLIHSWNAHDGTTFTEPDQEERAADDRGGGERCDVDGCCCVFKTRRGLTTHKRMAHK